MVDSNGFPAGLIASVDRDGNSTYPIIASVDRDANARHPSVSVDHNDSNHQLTDANISNDPPPRKRRGWSFRNLLCRCFAAPSIDQQYGDAFETSATLTQASAVELEVMHRESRQETGEGEEEPMFHDIAIPETVPPTPDMPLLPHKQLPHKVTLILDLDETLVHSSFKPVSGADWVVPVEVEGTVHRVFVCKRPGLDFFMQRVAELFEVVVFTASLDKYANPVLDLLEKAAPHSVHHRLFREACVQTHGALVKDLTRLGRNVRQVIIVDNSPMSYLLQPENAIPISSWFDAPTDQQLILLLPWLMRLAAQDDVLPILAELRGVLGAGGGCLQPPNQGFYAPMVDPHGYQPIQPSPTPTPPPMLPPVRNVYRMEV